MSIETCALHYTVQVEMDEMLLNFKFKLMLINCSVNLQGHSEKQYPIIY